MENYRLVMSLTINSITNLYDLRSDFHSMFLRELFCWSFEGPFLLSFKILKMAFNVTVNAA